MKSVLLLIPHVISVLIKHSALNLTLGLGEKNDL